MSEVQIWKPICFDEYTWGHANTTAFDRIAPSWMEYRVKLNEQQGEYAKFIQTLKYEHAVETGIIERLYDVDEKGVTITLLKDGINNNFLQHGDVENPETVMALIRDQYEAIDGIFSFIKNERPISTSFIKEFHMVITRSQETTEAVTPQGEMIRVPLLRGEYKYQENNPSHRDGTVFKYCPPFQVSMEMDNLIQVYNTLLENKVHVIIRAAFFHHALTTIHPFQDGNGRVTRVLTCLILIRDGYFPFSVKRKERNIYLDALARADVNDIQPFVDYMSTSQIRAIESALSLKKTEHDTLESVVDALKDRLKEKETVKQESINIRRNEINIILKKHIKHMQEVLQQKLGFDIHFNSEGNTEQSQRSITHKMGIYATKYGYFMKRAMPCEWFGLSFLIGEQRFMIIVFTHHFGQTDDAIAIGGVLETSVKEGLRSGSNTRKSKYGDFNIIPLEVPPLNLSLLADINETTKSDIQAHAERLILVAMAGIVTEI